MTIINKAKQLYTLFLIESSLNIASKIVSIPNDRIFFGHTVVRYFFLRSSHDRSGDQYATRCSEINTQTSGHKIIGQPVVATSGEGWT